MGFPSILLGLCLFYLSAAQECGQPRIPRIVGGQDAIPGKWPWQVSILWNMRPICGASVISEQWILSAAHCFYNNPPDSIYMALLGAHQLFNLPHDAVFAMVKKIILHPDYSGKLPSLGDIALIQLETPLNFTNSIMPICLPTSSENLSMETDCWVTGWGAIEYEVQSWERYNNHNIPLRPPLTLQEVKVPLISQDDCNWIYNLFPVRGLDKDPIKDDMICAGYPNSGKDSCQGDSGGPLACQLQGRWTQAGIVSWGIGCASTIYPGVYTSVLYYSDWIKDVMENIDKEPNSSNAPTQNLSTPKVPTQNASILVIPIQNVSNLLACIQNASTLVVSTQNLSTPVVPTQNASILVVPTQNEPNLVVPIQNSSTLILPIQNVSPLVVSTQNLSNLVLTTLNVSDPVAPPQNEPIENVSNLVVPTLVVLLLSIGLNVL